MKSPEQHKSPSKAGWSPTLREIKDSARDLDPASETMRAVWDQRERADKLLAEKEITLTL